MAHLLKVDGRFHFRWVLPVALSDRFKLKEIRFSLFTYDRKHAETLEAQHFARCKLLGNQPFTTAQEAIQYVRGIVLDGHVPLLALLKTANTQALQEAFRILDAHGVPIYVRDPYSATPSYVKVPYFETSYHLPDTRTVSIPQFAAPTVPNVHLHQLMVNGVPEAVLSQIRSQQVPTVTQNAKLPTSELLSDRIEQFLKVNWDSWSESTRYDYKQALNLFLEITPDKPYIQFTADDYDAFVLKLRKVPPNRNKGAKAKMSIDELIALGLPPISNATVEKYHSRCVALFNWIEDRSQGRYRINLHLPTLKSDPLADEDEGRQPYSDAELKLIFDSQQMVKLIEDSFENYKVWIPLISLFTGARVGEISALKASDFKQQDGLWTYTLTGTKSKNAKRAIPIAQQLLNLQLLKFVEKQKDQDRLFMELKYETKSRYGRAPSRWFNETVLPELGIKTDQVVLHSFRHNVGTMANRAKVDRWRTSIYMGHRIPTDEAESVRSYMNDKRASDLLPVVQALNYNLDFTRFATLTTRTYK